MKIIDIYLEKEGDPEQTYEAPHIENFVFQSQIYLSTCICFLL